MLCVAAGTDARQKSGHDLRIHVISQGMKDSRIVYILRSQSHPDKTYIGLTFNLKERLRKHNEGFSRYTNNFRPWRIEVAIWFQNEQKAFEFERYLKNGSGHAFRKRHFESNEGAT